MSFYDNNGFWDDLCEVNECYEIGAKRHAGRLFCERHWVYYASVLGLEELDFVPKAEWTEEDKIRSRGFGIVFEV